METEEEYTPGEGIFCEAFGDTPRNRIMESFLFSSCEHTIEDTAEDTGLPNIVTYEIMQTLLKEEFIIPTRKVSEGQLYTLNKKSKRVQVLLQIGNLLTDRLTKEYAAKYPQEALQH